MNWASLLVVLAFAPGRPSPADRAARAGAQTLLDAAATAHSRDCYDVELPASIGFEPSYEVEFVRRYMGFAASASVIRVTRDATAGAHVHRFDAAGVVEAKLDAAQTKALDRWLRTALYLDNAQQMDKGLCVGGIGFASHAPSYAMSVRAGGKVLLQIDPTQALADDLDASLPDFAATTATRTLDKLVRGALLDVAATPVPPAAAMKALKKLPPLGRAKGKAAAEAILYAHQLFEAKHRKAVTLLRRKDFGELALKLSLATTPLADLASTVAPLLCASEFGTRRAALAVLPKLGDDARAPLLHATRCRLDEWAQTKILGELAALGPDPATLAALDRAADGAAPLRVQVAARTHRYALRGDANDREFLERTARGPSGPLREVNDEQRMAVAALIDSGRHVPARAPAVAALLAALLGRIPADAHSSYSGMAQLVAGLGELGGAAYDTDIRRALLHTDASVVEVAIDAMAHYDIGAAADEARGRIALYNEGKGTGAAYSWYVLTFFDVLIRAEDDRARVPLKRALARYRREERKPDPWATGSHRAAIAFVSARTDADKAAAGIEFVRAYGEPSAALRAFLVRRFDAIDDAAIEAAIAEHALRAARWY